MMPRRLIHFRTESGFEPYWEFVRRLRDRIGAARIRARILRAAQGNLGDYRSVGEGVIELRIHSGPGYRVYAGLYGEELIVLLCAGEKSSQADDIGKAIAYWRAFRRAK